MEWWNSGRMGETCQRLEDLAESVKGNKDSRPTVSLHHDSIL